MAEKSHNGGPAFPGIRIEAGDNYNPPKQIHRSGMTLRDYLAAHEQLDPNQSIGKTLAEKLTGRRLPEMTDFVNQYEFALAAAIFWADAEAAYRYLRADAMLRARSAK